MCSLMLLIEDGFHSSSSTVTVDIIKRESSDKPDLIVVEDEVMSFIIQFHEDPKPYSSERKS